MRRNWKKRRLEWELKVMDLGLQKASDFGKRRYPPGEFDIAYMFYELEWTWSEMLWLVSSHRIVEAKRTSSVGADIEGDVVPQGNPLQEVSLISKATMDGNDHPLPEAAEAASSICQSHSWAL